MNALKQLKVKPGEPPKDGWEYLAFGNLIYKDDCVTCVVPFVTVIRCEDGEWVNSRGLSIRTTPEDLLHFHSHADVRQLEPGLAEKVVELFHAEHNAEREVEP